MALAGILVVLHSSLDMKALVAGKYATLLFALTPAMRPRMLLTLDSEGQLLPVPVRVGQAVDVVAQVTPFQHAGPSTLSVTVMRHGDARGLHQFHNGVVLSCPVHDLCLPEVLRGS